MERSASKAGTRRRILTAASRLFAHRGFEYTSVKVIAGSARVAHGTVFLHFLGKAQLYAEVIRNAGDQFLHRMCERSTANRNTFAETLDRWVSELAQGDDASTLLRTDNRTNRDSTIAAAARSVDVCFVAFWHLRLESWFGDPTAESERLRELARLIVLTASGFAAVRLEGTPAAKSAALTEDLASAIETMATGTDRTNDAEDNRLGEKAISATG